MLIDKIQLSKKLSFQAIEVQSSMHCIQIGAFFPITGTGQVLLELMPNASPLATLDK